MQRCLTPTNLIFLFLILFTPILHSEELTILHTGGVGRIFDGGEHDDDWPSEVDVHRTLKKLRSSNPDALALDSGGFLGPSSMMETRFAFQSAQALRAMDVDAVNVSGRDMLYGRRNFYYNDQGPAFGLPLVSIAEYSYNQKPAEKLDVQRDDRSIRIVGIGDLESFKKNMLEQIASISSAKAATLAEQVLRDGADGNRLNIVLSARMPEENNRLAAALPSPALILEQTFDWPSEQKLQQDVRRVGGTWIASKSQWWTADRVELVFEGDEITQCKVKPQPYKKSFKPQSGGLFALLQKNRPGDTLWRAQYWAHEKPELGRYMTKYDEFRRLGMDIDDVKELCIEAAPGAKKRLNQDVYFYRLMSKGKTVMDFIMVHHGILPGFIVVDMRFGIDVNGKVTYARGIAGSRILGMSTGVSKRVAEAVAGKSLDEAIELDFDLEQFRGLEFEAQPTILDMREALRLYRDYRDKAVEKINPDEQPVEPTPFQFKAK